MLKKPASYRGASSFKDDCRSTVLFRRILIHAKQTIGLNLSGHQTLSPFYEWLYRVLGNSRLSLFLAASKRILRHRRTALVTFRRTLVWDHVAGTFRAIYEPSCPGKSTDTYWFNIPKLRSLLLVGKLCMSFPNRLLCGREKQLIKIYSSGVAGLVFWEAVLIWDSSELNGLVIPGDQKSNPFFVSGLAIAKQRGLEIGAFEISDVLNIQHTYPIALDKLFVWSRKQKEFFNNKARSIYLKERQRCDLVLVSDQSSPKRIGILLHSRTSQSQLEVLLKEINRTYIGCSVKVRLHPNDRKKYSLHGASLASLKEGLETFCQSVDIIFSGTTSAMSSALRTGTPVVYCLDLDSWPHDAFGYIDQGLVLVKWDSFPNYDAINKFYGSDRWKARADAAFNVKIGGDKSHKDGMKTI